MSVAKSSFALKENVKALLDQYPLEQIGFLTLTFEDNVDDIKEANRRLDSLMSNYLREKLLSYILIRERQHRGAWHFHLLAVLPFDIKSKGRFQKKSFGKGHSFKTSNIQLLQLWKELRDAMPRYGFGRHELLPIRKDSGSLSGYLSKYIGKHMAARKESDKGVRLISYAQGFKRAVTIRFSWHSSFYTRLRQKVQVLALNERCYSPEDALRDLGHTWGFRLFNVAAHIVRMMDITRFNLDQAHYVPWAPRVSFIDGQICNVASGEIHF